jgi:hypothetical protein
MASEILKLINELPEQLPPDPTRDQRISQAAKISKIDTHVRDILHHQTPVLLSLLRPAEVFVGLLTGLGTVSVVLRTYLHIKNRGKLFLDDWLVIFANICLLVETGLLYHIIDMVYVETVVSTNPTDIVLFTRGQVMQMFTGMLKWNNIYLPFAWTTNYAIKLSFLALFDVLISNVTRGLRIYWWFALCFTIASWLFVMLNNFILCGASQSSRSLRPLS